MRCSKSSAKRVIHNIKMLALGKVSKINDINFHLKKLESEDLSKPKEGKIQGSN